LSQNPLKPHSTFVNNPASRKSWTRRLIRVLLIAEFSYLLLINLALQLPLTQTLINQIRPEKFNVSWQRAWSWYPFRVHVRGASADGQSRTQQWQFEASSVAASITILPLIFKRVWINDVSVSDIDYRQRPRLKPDKDFDDIIAFFPPINGREITGAVTTPRKKKRPWRVLIDTISVDGSHSYWIYQVKGKVEGGFTADLKVQTRGGPYSLATREVNLDLDTLYINEAQEIFKHGRVRGELGFTPFNPRANKGIKLLKFALLDVDLEFDSNSLAFINLFTRNFNGLKIDGQGQVAGHLNFANGVVLEGTDLSIDAGNLLVEVLTHQIEGEGGIDLELGPATDGLLDLRVQYRNLEVKHDGDREPLLTGQGLSLFIAGDGDMFPDQGYFDDHQEITLAIDGLSVPDLALFQRYLPDKWPFLLYGGSGKLEAVANMSSQAMALDLAIASDRADMGLHQYRFHTNLDFALKLDNPSVMTSNTKIDGSYLKLTDAHLTNDQQEEGEPWYSSFVVTQGHFGILDESRKRDQEDVVDLFQLAGQADAKGLLGSVHGSMQFESSVSSLAWISALLGSNYHSGAAGKGSLDGQIILEHGMPATGTRIEAKSEALAVNFLDYISNGDGKITFEVKEGGDHPDWLMEILLSDAELKRPGEAIAYIQDVDLTLKALLEDVSFDKKEKQFALELKILSAHVTDMSVYNIYLPPDSPLQLTGGTAELGADILLQNDDADGWIKLESPGLEAEIDGQSITADLMVDIEIVDGVPADMIFDFKGSKLSLGNVFVTGENEEFDQDSWSASITLTRGDTVWKKPLQLKAEADIRMKDSRPVVVLFNNQGWRPEWLLNMLTIEDIEGTAELNIANERMVIPYAFASSDKIEVGAKGSITRQRRDGVIYVRYKKLDAVIKISDGKKNPDIIGAREKFDQYQPLP